jgi:hypothetical protein
MTPTQNNLEAIVRMNSVIRERSSHPKATIEGRILTYSFRPSPRASFHLIFQKSHTLYQTFPTLPTDGDSTSPRKNLDDLIPDPPTFERKKTREERIDEILATMEKVPPKKSKFFGMSKPNGI